MADWLEVVQYLRSNYRIEEGDGVVHIDFHVGDGRTQIVSITRRQVVNEQWVIIDSPFARLDRVDVERVLHETLLLVWGIATTGTHLLLRHSLPLQTLDIMELETPLHLLTVQADVLEAKWMNADSY